MAQYISGNIKGLAGVRCDLVSQATGLRIESTHSVWLGGWKFNKPTPGLYDIEFYGRDVLESDWLLNYEVTKDDPYLGGEVTYTFWNGVAPYNDSKIVKENEFGWFSQSQLKFHIAGEGKNPNINITAINYRIFYNGSWTAWIPDAPGVPATTHEMDIDIAIIANIAGENNIIEFYVAFEDGTQDMVTTVPFKYDDTAPIFNITPLGATGGFGRIGLEWINVDVSDALSGIGYILVYRDTNDSFSGAVEIGRISVRTSVIPNSFIDNTMPQDDQSTLYYYWGKAQDKAGNLSAEARLDTAPKSIVLLLPADVDGALRIQNNPSGVNWEVIYGIRVPIQAVIITAGVLVNVTAITAVQYKEDDDDTWHDVPTPQYNGQTISYPYSVVGMVEGETLTFLFPTVILNKKYHRVVFNHAGAETEIAMVHFESILAADIIIGGVLRLEKGLSIWTGVFDANGVPTESGMYIDKEGLIMWDELGNVNMQLNNNGSAVIGRAGEGQITLDSAGVITIDSDLLNITATTTFQAGYDPAEMRQVFTSQPTPPYYVDDLWMDGTDIFITDTERVPPAAFNAGDWSVATNYDDSTDKATRWIQPSTDDPSSGWTAQEKLDHKGDQWVKTDQGYKLFTWTGAEWIQDYTEIDGGHIDTYSISAEKLAIGAVSWTTTIIFEPDDSTGDGYRFLKWNSGNIKFSNGELKSGIPLGSLKSVSDPRSWVYYNEATNTILLTPTYSDAVGVGKTLMAIVDRGDPAGRACVINPIYNTGTTIDADGIITGRLSSFDGNTYFDLINNIIKLRISAADRVVIGDLGGGNYGIKCYDASGNLLMRIDDSEQIIQSADGKTYFDMKNQYFRVHSTTERVRVGKYGTEYGIVVWDGSSNILLQITDTVQKIQSADGKTYFDLASNILAVNDGINRVVIGKMSTNVYGIKIYSAANVLMFQIDDNTQKITSADGKTYFDLGGNILVMENGTIIAGSITGATITAGSITGSLIKTASGNVDRVEMDSNGIRIYNYLDGLSTKIRFFMEEILSSQIYIESGTGNMQFTSTDPSFNSYFQFQGPIRMAGYKGYIDVRERQPVHGAPDHTADYGKLWAQQSDHGTKYTQPMWTTDGGHDDMIMTVMLKTTTGNPSAWTGRMVINTADNNIKIYADGAWRQIASWT